MRGKKGFSLVEVLIAATVTVILLGGILSLTLFVNSSWKTAQVKSTVRHQLETVMERLQRELRKSDMQQIIYYPGSSMSHTAVSFPVAIDDDGDGYIELTGGSTTAKIIWDQNVIYHTYDNTETEKVELRRTTFSPRIDMTRAEYQTQLDNVVDNGIPVVGCPNYSNWDTETGTVILLENDDVSLTIAPVNKTFDGYSDIPDRGQEVNFGSIVLAPGSHEITFTAVDKNPLATNDYKIGVDLFSIDPSAGEREGEEATVSACVGTNINEDMTAFGVWSGNRHLEFEPLSVNDYITLDFYYDQWIETNFESCMTGDTYVEYSRRNGNAGDVGAVGTEEYVARLDGYGESWIPSEQTDASESTSVIPVVGSSGTVIRNVIFDTSINTDGRAIKITFKNPDTVRALAIDYADIMVQILGPDGDAATRKQITFPPGTSTSIVIGTDDIAESNWIDVNDFERANAYLLTFCILGLQPNDIQMATWEDVVVTNVDSYYREGDIAVAQDETWSDNAPTKSRNIYTVSSIFASYLSSGTLTSQVYDTQVSNPIYSTLEWELARDNYGFYATPGLGANLIIRVRSDDDEDALLASTDWTGTLEIDTNSAITGTEVLNDISGGRYVQFQAEFDSRPTDAATADYTQSCVLEKVRINWPGEEKRVSVNGYYTRRSDCGIFSVKVDGVELVKSIQVTGEISEELSEGESITESLTTEVEPRNTDR